MDESTRSHGDNWENHFIKGDSTMLHGISIFVDILVVVRRVDEVVVLLGDDKIRIPVIRWETKFLRMSDKHGVSAVTLEVFAIFVAQCG